VVDGKRERPTGMEYARVRRVKGNTLGRGSLDLKSQAFTHGLVATLIEVNGFKENGMG
jgi:hypothetical protein